MIICPFCTATNPESANYCAQCGTSLHHTKILMEETASPRYRWAWFWLTLMASIAFSVVLIVIFHIPVFFLGLFLPLIWHFKPHSHSNIK